MSKKNGFIIDIGSPESLSIIHSKVSKAIDHTSVERSSFSDKKIAYSYFLDNENSLNLKRCNWVLNFVIKQRKEIL